MQSLPRAHHFHQHLCPLYRTVVQVLPVLYSMKVWKSPNHARIYITSF